MDWRLFLCVLLTWSLGSASLANRPLDESRSSDDDFVEHLQGLPRSRQKRQSSTPGCSGSILTLKSPGEIRSPNFPRDYPNNAECNWRLIAPTDQKVLVAFTWFSLDPSDSLKIYNGYNSHGTLVKNLCGRFIPSTHSNRRYMFLNFTSDNSGTSDGFKISFTFGPDGGGENLACAGNVQTLNNSGEITSPNFPQLYPKATLCQWRIRAPANNIISLVFQAFDLEFGNGCPYDSLKIYNGATSLGVRLATYCGNRFLLNTSSSGRDMFLLFRSDLSFSRTGFKIQYSFQPARTTGCHHHITSDSEILSTPNYPRNYPVNTDCVWDITAPLGQVIRITNASLFHLEESPFCIFDYIMIYDGQSTDNSIIARLCGSLLSISYASTSNHLYIIFHSDEFITESGFQLAIEFRVPDTTATTTMTPGACGGRLHGSSGELHSPNFGTSRYPSNSVCKWYIEVAEHQIILLEFHTLHLSGPSTCPSDVINTYDRHTASGSRLSYYCGNRTRNLPSIRSTGRYMTVIFISDGVVELPGFNATYRSMPQATENPCGSGRPAIVKLSQDAKEVIQYPANGGTYPKNAHCQWQITAPPGKRFQVHFNSFDLERGGTCASDKLKLLDGPTTKHVTFGQFCDTGTPPDAFSSGNIIMVQFRSDGYVERRGFKITLSAVDAAGSEPACGIPDSSWVHGNIIGGQETSPHIWPWQILLQKDRRFICGGSILSKDWIITAAHCVNRIGANRLSVIVGEHNRTATEGTEQIYAVYSVSIHAQFRSASKGNDIALLRLASGIHYTTAIKPICLPQNNATSGTTCYATGWGETGGYRISNVLMEVTLQIINQSMCYRPGCYGPKITSSMLCAGYAQGGRDTSTCDSGGPLVCLSRGKFLLQGITSWGYVCGRRNNHAGFYTRVSQLTQWVGNKTNGAFQSAP